MTQNFEIAVIALLVIGLVLFAAVAGIFLRRQPSRQHAINALVETQRNAVYAMRDMHRDSLQAMQTQNDRALQAVEIAYQSGARLQERRNGNAIALLPDGTQAALTPVQAEYWRELQEGY